MAKVPVKPYYIKELASLYDVSHFTMAQWIKKIPDLGDRIGYKWTTQQVKKIFDHLGEPEKEN